MYPTYYIISYIIYPTFTISFETSRGLGVVFQSELFGGFVFGVPVEFPRIPSVFGGDSNFTAFFRMFRSAGIGFLRVLDTSHGVPFPYELKTQGTPFIRIIFYWIGCLAPLHSVKCTWTNISTQENSLVSRII